jgi:ribosome recycling factor
LEVLVAALAAGRGSGVVGAARWSGEDVSTVSEQSQEILEEVGIKMELSLEAMAQEMASIRTGRATPALLDKIRVEYFGSRLPINQVATVSAPEPRLLLISPWDKSVLTEIDRALSSSDLGLVPQGDGEVIRLPIPQLTEERRQEMARLVGKKAEEGKVAIRNIRREANEHLRKLEKSGELSEDESHRALEEVQKLTDDFVEKAEALRKAKEAELLEI